MVVLIWGQKLGEMGKDNTQVYKYDELLSKKFVNRKQ